MPRFFAPADLLLRTAEALRTQHPIEPDAPILVGFGGGPDALALAWVLKKLGHPVQLAFVDHGPPLDGPLEWPAAQAAAKWLALPLLRLPLSSHPRSEDAARIARHAALAAHAHQLGIRIIALGHHADDQAETLLFRLVRGTGPQGAGSIAPWREAEGKLWLRPLLEFSRAELRLVLKALQAPIHEDAANDDLSKARNHLRQRVLPELESRHPGAGLRMAQAAQRFREASESLRRDGKAWAQALTGALGQDGALVDAQAWLALGPSQQAFAWQAILHHCGAPPKLGEAATLKALRLAIVRGEALALPQAWRWQADRGPWWALVAPPRPAILKPLQLGFQDTESWGWRVLAEAWAGQSAQGGVRLPATGPAGPWCWRLAQAGDRLSVGGRQQPLARHLAALGWGPFRQQGLLALASGQEVAWVVGAAIGDLAQAPTEQSHWWLQAQGRWGRQPF